MTPLTVSEKERVAGLLGDNVRWQCACGASYETRNQGERNCGYVAPMVTLEACMEYAKGKGWGHSLEWSEDEDAPEPGHFSYISLVMAGWQGWRFRSPDPLAAMVRALLKAEEASHE